ncbi:hypothetical protein H1C71_028558 [Ictidomys tridecemlineatus]|nr:hypothetical protein H1C71_028558 [Ictidomys tridecemlineatus]
MPRHGPRVTARTHSPGRPQHRPLVLRSLSSTCRGLSLGTAPCVCRHATGFTALFLPPVAQARGGQRWCRLGTSVVCEHVGHHLAWGRPSTPSLQAFAQWEKTLQ